MPRTFAIILFFIFLVYLKTKHHKLPLLRFSFNKPASQELIPHLPSCLGDPRILQRTLPISFICPKNLWPLQTYQWIRKGPEPFSSSLYNGKPNMELRANTAHCQTEMRLDTGFSEDQEETIVMPSHPSLRCPDSNEMTDRPLCHLKDKATASFSNTH